MPSRKQPTRNVDGAYRKALVALLADLSHSRSRRDVFSDFVESAAIAVANNTRGQFRGDREETYLRIVKRAGADAMNAYAKGLAILTDAIVAEPGDVLGDVYQGLGVNNEHAGQFFTPYHISRFMAEMTLHDLPEVAREKHAKGETISILDPSVGAGGLLLAAAHVALDKAVPLHHLTLYGTDVDKFCVQMSYLQLRAIGAPAVIWHGNSLSGEVWDTWVTPAYVYQVAALKRAS